MKFIFDLDGTITQIETLPFIAEHFGLEDQINELTMNTIKGNIPFIESFIRRVGILGKYSVSETRELLSNVELFSLLVNFIKENSDDCIIATANLDVWIDGLCKRLSCQAYSSKALVENDQVVKIDTIFKKEDLVRELQSQGEEVVYIGEGNNDAEAMRFADYAIGSGLVHWPAKAVMQVADFVVFDEKPLVRLLNQMKNGDQGVGHVSLVISCAGFGSRLGLNSTKALINFEGKPLIEWQLKNFNEIEDIRLVVGFEADKVIEAVRNVRRDAIFVFNHDYFSTGTGYSLFLGAQFANEYVLAWDGDLLVHHDDITACLSDNNEYLGISDVVTDDAVHALLSEDEAFVDGFSRQHKTPYEWSGPARLKRDRITKNNGNVFEGLIDQLPLPAKYIKAFDIDTPNDYSYAIENFRSYVLGK